ncbi:hypothetical protein E2C01_066077 [Portunus trituberculatus]|uniref:Uncharacterized protein n=1 Tax=Portunus trituberculatus TaxID=210409 RepID=A0A5B7HSX0_PORTR|nr:hypothetical protein [Portunus trituberculatus]
MGYLSAHWPKPPSRQDQFGYRIFGYGVAISASIGRDSRGLSVLHFFCGRPCSHLAFLPADPHDSN